MNDISIFLPLVKAVLIIVLVPVLLILIFKTERKQVKHAYQLREAYKALVNLDSE